MYIELDKVHSMANFHRYQLYCKLDLEVPIFAHICVFSSMTIFIKIVNVLDQFKGQILIEYIGKFKRDYFANGD